MQITKPEMHTTASEVDKTHQLDKQTDYHIRSMWIQPARKMNFSASAQIALLKKWMIYRSRAWKFEKRKSRVMKKMCFYLMESFCSSAFQIIYTLITFIFKPCFSFDSLAMSLFAGSSSVTLALGQFDEVWQLKDLEIFDRFVPKIVCISCLLDLCRGIFFEIMNFRQLLIVLKSKPLWSITIGGQCLLHTSFETKIVIGIVSSVTWIILAGLILLTGFIRR